MTIKQKLFVYEYLIDHNATQAAIRAGYSEKTAYSIGQRLLKNVEIRKCLRQHIDDVAERSGITLNDIVTELKKVGFADVIQVNANEKTKALMSIAHLLGLDEKATTEELEDMSDAEREVFGDG